MADFEAWLVFLILVVNVVGELQRKRTLTASRGFLAAARLSCFNFSQLRDTICKFVLRSHVVCLSVYLSVCDVGEL